MINKENTLPVLDQFPQEVNEKQRFANARGARDDYFVNARLDIRCNHSIAIADVQLNQSGGWYFRPKVNPSVMFSSVVHVVVEWDLAE